MKRKPPKFTIEKYEITRRVRDYDACMENRNDDSVWTTISEERFRIKLGHKVLCNDYRTEEVAKEHLKLYRKRFSGAWLKKQETLALRRYLKSVEKAAKFRDRTVKKLRKQALHAKNLGF